jgi:hypothetical protein
LPARLAMLVLLIVLQASVGGFIGDAQARGLGSAGPRSAVAKPKPKLPRQVVGYYLSTSEIATVKRNIQRYAWARLAWQNTMRRANDGLGAEPQPADPKGDYSARGTDGGNADCSRLIGWFCALYHPGFIDGQLTLALAHVYAVTGDRRYGDKAKEFLLAWARAYNPPAPMGRVGHDVAEPVGFMIKAFLAYDLVRRDFSPAEQAEFSRWALLFVERGMATADYARDHPWVPEAPYGNGATWQRGMAVLAAAAAGEPYLSETLRWNWQHTTAGGRDYGWLTLLDGAIEADGRTAEERVRSSVSYGLYTLYPLELIADVAYHAGYSHDLFRVETQSGKSLRREAEHYVPYLMGRPDPYPGSSDGGYGSGYQSSMEEYRTAYELLAKRIPESKLLRAAVRYQGSKARGNAYDAHISGFNALQGSP